MVDRVFLFLSREYEYSRSLRWSRRSLSTQRPNAVIEGELRRDMRRGAAPASSSPFLREKFCKIVK